MSVVVAHIAPLLASISGPENRALQIRVGMAAMMIQRVEGESDPVRILHETAVKWSVSAAAHPLDIAVARICEDDAFLVGSLQGNVFVQVCREVPIGFISHGSASAA